MDNTEQQEQQVQTETLEKEAPAAPESKEIQMGSDEAFQKFYDEKRQRQEMEDALKQAQAEKEELLAQAEKLKSESAQYRKEYEEREQPVISSIHSRIDRWKLGDELKEQASKIGSDPAFKNSLYTVTKKYENDLSEKEKETETLKAMLRDANKSVNAMKRKMMSVDAVVPQKQARTVAVASSKRARVSAPSTDFSSLSSNSIYDILRSGGNSAAVPETAPAIEVQVESSSSAMIEDEDDSPQRFANQKVVYERQQQQQQQQPKDPRDERLKIYNEVYAHCTEKTRGRLVENEQRAIGFCPDAMLARGEDGAFLFDEMLRLTETGSGTMSNDEWCSGLKKSGKSFCELSRAWQSRYMAERAEMGMQE